MKKNYKLLTENVRSRINPDKVAFTKAFSEELSTISYSDVLTYIRVSMKSVEPEYTQKSKEAGEKVKEHLSKHLTSVTFEYQGSVMTNTHIKGHSDIDLLTICDKFYSYDAANAKEILNTPERRNKYSSTSISKIENEVNTESYKGNATDDLRAMRLKSEEVLKDVYTKYDLDHPKAIKISNLSLKRDVDIVISNWYDDVRSIINDKGIYRGIQVYNKESHKKEKADYPFHSIKRINDRSTETGGRFKKMIRFLKNTKANSDHDFDLSSFDINAVCYDIDPKTYSTLSIYELVPVLYKQLKSICNNKTHSDEVVSVDGREYIFRGDSSKLENLKKLLAEVEAIHLDYSETLLSK